MTRSKLMQRLSEYASVAGAGIAFTAMIFQITDHWKLNEAIVGGVTIAATAVAGITSLYLARVAKSISSHKRIFISYSYDQKEKAQQIRKALMDRGAYVWLDVNDLQPGSEFDASINSAIESSNTVIAVLSDTIGSHLKREISSAISKNVPVVAIAPSKDNVPQDLAKSKMVIYLDNSASMENVASAALKHAYAVAS